MKMSMKKKLIALVLASSVMGTLVAGCVGGGNGDSGNTTKITVGIIDAGIKDEFVNKMIDRFEEDYKDYSFEDGKTGVTVSVVANDSYAGDTAFGQIPNSEEDVFFTESIYYDKFVKGGVFAEITDIVTSDMEDVGEAGKTIEDKLTDGQKNFLKTSDKYYALPFYEAFSGLYYDADLFAEKQLYFAKGGCPSEFSAYTQANNADKASGSFSAYAFTKNGAKSAGTDGKYGTSDDGLPATYDEFFKLCDEMLGTSVKPLTWPGRHADYINEFATALTMNYEGMEKGYINYTLNGTVDLVDTIDANGNVTTKTETINNKNGYLLYQQPGRYYALDFISRIAKNPNYYNRSAVSGDHYACHEDFLYGRFDSDYDKIGMIIEGSWWYNESDYVFEEMESYGESAYKENRNINIMPFPHPTEDQIGNEQTFVSLKESLAFINAKTTGGALKASKMFLKYAHTNKSLVEFQQTTNIPRAIQFTMTDDELNACLPYGRETYRIHTEENILYPYSTNPLYLSSPTAFIAKDNWNTNTSEGSFKKAVTAFMNTPNLTAKMYFDGLSTYMSKDNWDSIFSAYYN